MQTVEAKGTVQEIGGTFAGTTDAAEFNHVLRHDTHFVHRTDDLVGDRIVSAALAQRARVAAVIIFYKAGQVHICGCASHRKRLCHKITPFTRLLRYR